MTNWFVSDIHFGHRNIITYCNRPYKDIEEMHEAIIKIWNNTVKEGDTVYVIGDFSLNPRWSKTITPLLNGDKILIVGNHNKPFKHIVKSNEVYSIEHTNREHNKVCEQYLQDGWKLLSKELQVTLRDGTNVLLSHFPYAPKESENFDRRFLELRPKDEGMFLLCGHLHGKFIKNNNSIDVGIDAHNMKMLSEDDIINYIKDERKFIPSHLTDWYNERNKNSKQEAY